MKALVQAKAKLNLKDQSGLTPLALAASCGHDFCSLWLASQGAAIEVCDNPWMAVLSTCSTHKLQGGSVSSCSCLTADVLQMCAGHCIASSRRRGMQVQDADGDIPVAPQLLESLKAVQAGTLDVDELIYGS